MQGRGLMSRFLRSRVLPGAAVLVLIAGWLTATGSLFWRARVREEFALLGTLATDPSGRGGTISLQPVRWFSPPPAAIDAGREIAVSVLRGDGRKDVFRATLREPVADVAGARWALSLNPDDAIAIDRQSLPSGDQPVRIDLVVRQKRLLVAALEKAPLTRGAVAR